MCDIFLHLNYCCLLIYNFSIVIVKVNANNDDIYNDYYLYIKMFLNYIE